MNNVETIILQLTKFSSEEKKEDWQFENFIENNIPICFMSKKKPEKYSTRPEFHFGVKNNKGELFWFFKKTKILTKRETAIEVFQMLTEYCKEENIGEPFIWRK